MDTHPKLTSEKSFTFKRAMFSFLMLLLSQYLVNEGSTQYANEGSTQYANDTSDGVVSFLIPQDIMKVCVHMLKGSININTSINLTAQDSNIGLTCEWDSRPCVLECSPSPNANNILNGTSGTCEDRFFSSSIHNVEFKTFLGKCSAVLCNETAVVPLLQEIGEKSKKEDIPRIYRIRRMCQHLFKEFRELKELFINIEGSIIHNIMGISNVKYGGLQYHFLKELAVNVFNISEANLSSSAASKRIKLDLPELLPKKNTPLLPEAWLPVDALQSMTKEHLVIGLVSYAGCDHLTLQQEEILTMVIRIEILGKKHLVNLPTSVKMIFYIANKTDNDTQLQCGFFDERDYDWKRDGCTTEIRKFTNNTEIECSCDHTTPFAVLLMREPVAEVHWKILSYISYIGCGLSAFFTALSLMTYVFSPNHRMDPSSAIHASLSGALFLLNSAFLLSEWVSTVKADWVCVLTAAMTHYSLLCSFTWMSVEALHLYLLLVKVYNAEYRHYLLKLSLAGWGIPGVIVGVFVGVNDLGPFYGLSEMTLTDNNQTNKICWIVDDGLFYGLNLGYFTLTFLFNTGILLVVACRVYKLSRHKPGAARHGVHHGAHPRTTGTCKNGLTVAGLTCLLGTSWGLAFLGSGYTNYTILYLFCILNPAQGFFLFLWICGTVRKERKRAIEDKLSFATASSDAKSK